MEEKWTQQIHSLDNYFLLYSIFPQLHQKPNKGSGNFLLCFHSCSISLAYLINWYAAICTLPAFIIQIHVNCCRCMENYWKSAFFFFFFFLNKDFHVSNLVIVHQMFAREIPVRCGRISNSNACFCCGSVPVCIYGNRFLIHDWGSWIYK